VGLVHEEGSPLRVADTAESSKVGAVRVHAVVALDEDPCALLGPLRQGSGDGVEIVMWGDDDTGSGEPGPIDQ
jgi:hypothetical protein